LLASSGDGSLVVEHGVRLSLSPMRRPGEPDDAAREDVDDREAKDREEDDRDEEDLEDDDREEENPEEDDRKPEPRG